MPSEDQLQAFRQLPLGGRATEIARLFTLVSNSVEMFKKRCKFETFQKLQMCQMFKVFEVWEVRGDCRAV